MGYYSEQCGGLPSENYPDMDVATWWDCACGHAVAIRGVCSSDGYGFITAVMNDVQTEEGTLPYIAGTDSIPDGDYVTIYYTGNTRVYMGRYRWKCADVEEAEITEVIYPTSDVVVGSAYDVQVTMKNTLPGSTKFTFRLKEGTTEIDHSIGLTISSGVSWTQPLSGVMPNRTLNLTVELWRET